MELCSVSKEASLGFMRDRPGRAGCRNERVGNGGDGESTGAGWASRSKKDRCRRGQQTRPETGGEVGGPGLEPPEPEPPASLPGASQPSSVL